MARQEIKVTKVHKNPFIEKATFGGQFFTSALHESLVLASVISSLLTKLLLSVCSTDQAMLYSFVDFFAINQQP